MIDPDLPAEPLRVTLADAAWALRQSWPFIAFAAGIVGTFAYLTWIGGF